MREAQVQAAFVAHLRDRGWDVTPDGPDWADVRARRGTEILIAEVKGHTSSPGTDLDCAYGQILRRMAAHDHPDDADVRYALVMPTTLLTKAERVPQPVRDLLDLDLWHVDDLGGVHPPA